MALQKIPGRAIKLGTDTAGDVAYFDGSAWRRLPIGDAGQRLTMNATETAPEWFKFVYGGSEYGYGVMGIYGPDSKEVDKFSFASDGNAVHHCDTFSSGSHMSCCRSDTHGYVNAGEKLPHYAVTNRITKFAFASTVDGTDVADCLQALGLTCGNSSGTYGYISGGATSSTPTEVNVDMIQKYSVTADINATDVGDLTTVRAQVMSANSRTNGYVMGGRTAVLPVASIDNIERIVFATDGNSTDVANLTLAREDGAGCSSETHGYAAAGHSLVGGTNFTKVIDKFLFATDANSTAVGDLLRDSGHVGSSSSTTHGYMLGGWMNYQSGIDKFSFTTDSNGTSIGNLVTGREEFDGTQN
jgi:hypothetical protein